MSLINDALKKAARQRAEEQADLTPLMPGGSGSRARHGGPMRTQTLVLIGAAAVVLVVVSVVVTGAFVTSRPDVKEGPVALVPSAPKSSAPPNPAVSAPPIVAVSIPRMAAPSPAPTAAPTMVVPTAAPVAIVQAAVIATPAPQVSAPRAAPTVATAAVSSESRTEEVQAYVDGLHVTGARSAGSDSKALVDGHVFRLNDVLNKALGLRLTRVEPDHLVFVDGAGDTYQRSY